MNDFTTNEFVLLNLLSAFRNYDDLESELSDNAVGFYEWDIKEYTDMDIKVARGVISSLIQKDMIYTDSVNGKAFFRATDECLEFLYNVLDKQITR